jgi:hypothetical protein
MRGPSAVRQRGFDVGDGGWSREKRGVWDVEANRVVGGWSGKQRRAYHRILSGLTKGSKLGDHLRVITLTSSPASFRPVQRSFEILRKRVFRKFGFILEYAMVRTNEGPSFGVLHVVYRGGFIPWRWLKGQWSEIHRASQVWISKLDTVKGIARYFVSQYIAGQAGFVRLSYSLRWICRGACKLWYLVLGRYRPLSKAVNHWNELLVIQCELQRKWFSGRQEGLRLWWADFG